MSDSEYKTEINPLKINYRVLSVNPSEHSITIRYFTDIITEELLAIDLDENGNIKLDKQGKPLRCKTDYLFTYYPNNENMSKESIIKFIEDCAPVDYLSSQESLFNNGVDFSVVEEMIGFEGNFKFIHADFVESEFINFNRDRLLEKLDNYVEKYYEIVDDKIENSQQKMRDYIDLYFDAIIAKKDK